MSDNAGPWGAPPQPDSTRAERPGRKREPVINAPVAAVLLALSMPALYWLQVRDGRSLELIHRYGLVPEQVTAGALFGLVGALLLHGSWTHVLMNAVGGLSFGAPVSRLFDRPVGVVGFVSFYVVCGLLAGIGYVAVHPASEIPWSGRPAPCSA